MESDRIVTVIKNTAGRYATRNIYMRDTQCKRVLWPVARAVAVENNHDTDHNEWPVVSKHKYMLTMHNLSQHLQA